MSIPPQELAVPSSGTPKVASGPAPIAIGHALVAVLASLRERRPRLLKDGSLARRALEKTAEDCQHVLPVGAVDPLQMTAFVIALARAAGLVAGNAGRLEPDLAAADAHFALSVVEQYETLRTAWFNGSINDHGWSADAEPGDGLRPPGILDRHGFTPGAAEMRRAREAVIACLAELSRGSWIEAGRLSRAVGDLPPSVMPLSGLAGTETPFSSRGNGGAALAANPSTAASTLCEAMCRLPLPLLGYAELAVGGDGRRVIRPLDPSAPFVAEFNPKPFLMQSNFEVVALLPETDPGLLWRLARLSAPKDLQQVAHFQLQERHAAEAANGGLSADSMIALLRTHSKTPLPQNIEFTLREWVRRTERITIWCDAVLYEAEGVEDASTLVSDAVKAALGSKIVGGRHVVANAVTIGRPADAVTRRCPEFDYSRPLPAAIDVHADGTLACEAERLHFRASRMLDRVADPAGLDRWAVTNESLRRSIDSGIGLDRLVEMLREHARTPIPPLLMAKLMAWSGRGGEAWTGRPVLLSFTNPDFARLLRDGGALDGLLGRAINAQTFVLSPDQLSGAIAALNKLGIEAKPAEGDDFGDAMNAGPQTLTARVVEAPPTTGAIDLTKLAALWRRDSATACEIAVRARASAVVLVRRPGVPASRVTITFRSLVALPGRMWVEVEIPKHASTEVFDLAWLEEIGVGQPTIDIEE